MWADDILILSETEEGLQQKVDMLGEYCTVNRLTVNTKKTKCMIFNKTGRLLKNHKFTYNDTVLELINFEQAFDSLWLQDCILSLRKLGTPDYILQMIYNLNREAVITVNTPYGPTSTAIVDDIVQQ